MFLNLLDLVGTHVFGFPVKEGIGIHIVLPQKCAVINLPSNGAKAPIKSHIGTLKSRAGASLG